MPSNAGTGHTTNACVRRLPEAARQWSLITHLVAASGRTKAIRHRAPDCQATPGAGSITMASPNGSVRITHADLRLAGLLPGSCAVPDEAQPATTRSHAAERWGGTHAATMTQPPTFTPIPRLEREDDSVANEGDHGKNAEDRDDRAETVHDYFDGVHRSQVSPESRTKASLRPFGACSARASRAENRSGPNVCHPEVDPNHSRASVAFDEGTDDVRPYSGASGRLTLL